MPEKLSITMTMVRLLNLLTALYKPDEVIELRVTTQKGRLLANGYFTNLIKLVGLAAYWLPHGNVQIALNTVKPHLAQLIDNTVTSQLCLDTHPDDILRIAVLRIAFAWTSITDKDKQAAWEIQGFCQDMLTELGWPKPVILDSGTSVDLLYKVDMRNTKQNQQLIIDFLRTLNGQYSNHGVTVDAWRIGNSPSEVLVPIYGLVPDTEIVELPDPLKTVSKELIQDSIAKVAALNNAA